MSIATTDVDGQSTAATDDPFDLDITVLETSDEAATLINLTDDGCGSTCPRGSSRRKGELVRL